MLSLISVSLSLSPLISRTLLRATVNTTFWINRFCTIRYSAFLFPFECLYSVYSDCFWVVPYFQGYLRIVFFTLAEPVVKKVSTEKNSTSLYISKSPSDFFQTLITNPGFTFEFRERFLYMCFSFTCFFLLITALTRNTQTYVSSLYSDC